MLGSQAKVSIRRGKPGDAEALAEVFKDSWVNAYRGILPEFHLDKIVRRRDPAWWQTTIGSRDRMLVLEVGSKIVGYATFGPTRARGPYQGEIYELYLAPIYQGLGFGEHLFEACRYALDQKKLKGLVVWALVDNQTACHFYWRRGGRPVASVQETFGTTKLEKAAFAWP
jgi:ribosomal protein S18 acetylase RimI-like enzyme